MKRTKKLFALFMVVVMLVIALVALPASANNGLTDARLGRHGPPEITDSWTAGGFLGIGARTYNLTATRSHGYIVWLGRLSTPLFFNGINPITISVTSGINVARSLSHTLSTQVGISVPVEGARVAAHIGNSTAVGITTTVAHSQTFSTPLARGDRAGFYGFVWTVGSCFYRTTVRQGNNTWQGGMLRFRDNPPFVHLRFENTSF